MNQKYANKRTNSKFYLVGKILIKAPIKYKTCGYRAFSRRAPTPWNALPDDIRQVEHVRTFKSKLKTHLLK